MEVGRQAAGAAAGFVVRRWAAPAAALLAFVVFSMLSVFGVGVQQAQGCGTNTSIGTLPPPSGANENDVWATLTASGFSEISTAGVMGNMQTESGFDPTVLQGGGNSLDPAAAGSGGYGLVQWTPGARLIPLLNGAAPSIASEVAALALELRTTETAAGTALLQAVSPEQAADTFGLMYERYAGPPQPVRATQARTIYDRHLGSTPANGTGAAPCTPVGPGASGSAAAVIAEAAKWFGTPYSWGGGTLDGPSRGFAQGANTVGFDCSSYTRYAFFHGAGLLLPRTSGEQLAATAAHTVVTGDPDLNLLQPGDLLFWGSSAASIHHVALYVGDGQMVEEAHTGTVASQRAVYDGDFYAATRPLRP